MCFKVNSVLSESGPFNVLNPKVADMFVLSQRERERERETNEEKTKRQRERDRGGFEDFMLFWRKQKY
jgi:hypothetical protein